MNIGLFGYGTVGKGTYEICNTIKNLNILKIMSNNINDKDNIPVVSNPEEIILDDDINTIIELFGGIHPAYEIIISAMKAGKNVVTANKAIVCNYFNELHETAQANNVMFKYSAAVGGGIPWLHELVRASNIQKINEIYGILNGSCNYILNKMFTDNITYDDALKKAQDLGYAEANPSLDVDGIDTWHKLIISSNLAFNISLNKNSVPALGISNISHKDIDNFKNNSLICKLYAFAKNNDSEYNAFVMPCLIKEKELEANVNDNYNLISYNGEYSGKMSFFGQGAGRYPTSTNVVNDLLEISESNYIMKSKSRNIDACNKDTLYNFYISKDWDGKSQEMWGKSAITDKRSISDIIKWSKSHTDIFIAIILD